MPSILKQHGFTPGVKTAKLDATSDCNPDFVVRIPKVKATVEIIKEDRLSAFAISKGTPFLLRPRDTLTLHIDDTEILMSVLAVYPLATICQRRGVIDRAVLLLTVA
jgi:hypothetical protein